MPILSLAMLASNYSANVSSDADTRWVVDPQTTAINQQFWGSKLCSGAPSQARLMNSVLTEK